MSIVPTESQRYLEKMCWTMNSVDKYGRASRLRYLFAAAVETQELVLTVSFPLCGCLLLDSSLIDLNN